MNLQFLNSSDSLLKQSSSKIAVDQIRSKEIQEFIRSFVAFCGYEAQVAEKPNLRRMVGCAAPQVGKMIRLIVVDNAICPKKRNFSTTDLHILINPRIIWASNQKDSYSESCYSVPSCFSGIIQRPIAVVVEAYNEKAQRVRRRYEGYTARIVQHEVDHLDGICFPQRATKPQEVHKHFFERREDLLNYREHFENWKTFATEKEFYSLKRGELC